IALATGQWCALLDQDDALAANALAIVALEIEHYPDAGLFYSDEDKIDATGRRSNPFFKTDWNPELFLGQNFVNHLGVYRAELLERCLASIRLETDYATTEIVIVDNGSTESAALELLRREERRGDVRLVRDNGAFNYSRLINRGVSAAWGEVLALLNNDMEANEPGWLREMVSHAMRVGIGAVGARLWYPDGTLQHGGVILGLGGVAGHAFPRIPRG